MGFTFKSSSYSSPRDPKKLIATIICQDDSRDVAKHFICTSNLHQFIAHPQVCLRSDDDDHWQKGGELFFFFFCFSSSHIANDNDRAFVCDFFANRISEFNYRREINKFRISARTGFCSSSSSSAPPSTPTLSLLVPSSFGGGDTDNCSLVPIFWHFSDFAFSQQGLSLGWSFNK